MTRFYAVVHPQKYIRFYAGLPSSSACVATARADVSARRLGERGKVPDFRVNCIRHAACNAQISNCYRLGSLSSALANMNRFVLALIVVFSTVTPVLAFATPLDEPLHCDRPAREFIGALESQGLIDPHPSHVEANSINAFNPTRSADLTAFGFHVFAIVGYQKGDPMFQKGDGKPLADSAYGAVVLGATDSVKTAVRAGGSSAIVHHVAPFVTAIFCQDDAGKPAD